jgi:hypothetical protein
LSTGNEIYTGCTISWHARSRRSGRPWADRIESPPHPASCLLLAEDVVFLSRGSTSRVSLHHLFPPPLSHVPLTSPCTRQRPPTSSLFPTLSQARVQSFKSQSYHCGPGSVLASLTIRHHLCSFAAISRHFFPLLHHPFPKIFMPSSTPSPHFKPIPPHAMVIAISFPSTLSPFLPPHASSHPAPSNHDTPTDGTAPVHLSSSKSSSVLSSFSPLPYMPQFFHDGGAPPGFFLPPTLSTHRKGKGPNDVKIMTCNAPRPTTTIDSSNLLPR